MNWIKVASTHEIALNQWKLVSIQNTNIVIVNLNNEFLALEDVCTHDGSPLAGEPLEQDTIVCPRHGARFCLRTGKVLEGPAYEDAKTFAVKIENDEIFVEL